MSAPAVSCRARQMAHLLEADLARRNVPGLRFNLPNGIAALSLWKHLVAYTDGRLIWWNALRLNSRENHQISRTHSGHGGQASARTLPSGPCPVAGREGRGARELQH
jgi:hypothetical protein